MGVYTVVNDYLRRGIGGTLATIVRRVGATPQGTGARMFIGDDDGISGTLGGGCMEAEVWREARSVSRTKEAKLIHYALNAGQIEDEGMICGGSVDVFLEPVFDKYEMIYENIEEFRRRGKRALVLTCFGGKPFSKTMVSSAGEVLGDLVEDGLLHGLENHFHDTAITILEDTIIEPVIIAATVHIYGAGHLSNFVAKFAKMVDFNVIVFDDRADFANRDRFPDADEIIVDDFDNISQYNRDGDERYIVIVTRGHKHDAIVLEEVLKWQNRYVGMIGSKRKIAMVYDYLKEKGVDPQSLETVHAPIGIDIHSETPQEIAMSIVAELVKVRAEG